MCEKFVVDGFDYYVSEDEIKVGDYYLTFTNKTVIGNVRRCEDSSYSFTHCKKVIATNNPNIDIPKIINENKLRDMLFVLDGQDVYKAHDQYSQTALGGFLRGCKHGYSKSQETHSFSEEDMIEFTEWIIRRNWQKINIIFEKTTKELLQLWKEKQPKIVYYE